MGHRCGQFPKGRKAVRPPEFLLRAQEGLRLLPQPVVRAPQLGQRLVRFSRWRRSFSARTPVADPMIR